MSFCQCDANADVRVLFVELGCRVRTCQLTSAEILSVIIVIRDSAIALVLSLHVYLTIIIPSSSV